MDGDEAINNALYTVQGNGETDIRHCLGVVATVSLQVGQHISPWVTPTSAQRSPLRPGSAATSWARAKVSTLAWVEISNIVGAQRLAAVGSQYAV